MKMPDSNLWHHDLSYLPNISGEAVDKCILLQCVAKETSVRGYKFFHEHFIHEFEGKFVDNKLHHCM
jgi:hypothetical protein